jgi:two-component system, sensor histidine kinase and response regulator
MLSLGNEFLSSVLDTLLSGIVIVDPVTHRIVNVNAAALSMMGARREEVIGASCREFICHPERETCPLMALDGAVKLVEAFLLTRSGARLPILKRAQSVLVGGERFFVESFTDLTASRTAEHARCDAEARLRTITSAAQDGIIMIDDHGLIIYWNPAAERLFDYTAAEVMGRNLHQLLCPSRYLAAHAEGFRRFVVSGQGGAVGKTVELSARKKDGTEFPVGISLSAVQENGKWHAVGVIRDQTEQKRGEAELRFRNVLLATQQEASIDGILVVDGSGRVLSYNQRFVAIWGIPKEALATRADEVLLESVLDRLAAPEEFLARVRDLYARPRETSHEEVSLKDGRTLDRYSAPVFADDADYGRIWYFRDITDRKHIERALRESAQEATAASRAKSEFLANMSHEIRTPMNGIIGATELALGTPLSREQQGYLEIVRSSGQALLELINDILDLSKVEAGKLELEQIPFSLEQCLQGALNVLSPRAAEKGLELAVRVDPELPDRLVGDPGRLRQVLINLVGNAVKFTPGGEVVVTVTRDGGAAGGTLHVSVRDTGIGIPPEKQELIFQPFAQADGSTTRTFGGTGLGLAISASLVALMGGRMHLESAPGHGSTFHFWVELKAQLEGTPAPPAPEPELAGLPVLVVDDSATSREIVSAALASWRFVPTAVESGPAALAALAGNFAAGKPYLLLIIDSQMPGMSGAELVDAIASRPEWGAPVVLMKSSAMEQGLAETSARRGVKACLAKPFTPSQLLDAILSALLPGARLEGAAPVPVHPVAGDGRALRVLLAEDNSVNQILTRTMLEKRGHSVVIAGNGAEALRALERERFDLVLMDVQMPGMDGLQATATIRERERAGAPRTPIIALTAHAVKGDREMCLAAGMDDYLSKPIRSSELVRALEPYAREPAAPAARPVDDVQTILARFDGDRNMLSAVAEVFLADGPLLLEEVRKAVADGDARALERSAHALKGAVANFVAGGPVEAAKRLETRGRSGQVEGAQGVLGELELELAELRQTLGSLTEEHR